MIPAPSAAEASTAPCARVMFKSSITRLFVLTEVVLPDIIRLPSIETFCSNVTSEVTLVIAVLVTVSVSRVTEDTFSQRLLVELYASS